MMVSSPFLKVIQQLPTSSSSSSCHFFIHLLVCLTTGPKPLPKRPIHTVRSKVSSFKRWYPLFSLRLSSSFLRLLPRLPVTSITPFIFRSITRCRRQFRRKMWPIQFAFRLRISCRIFLCSLTLLHIYIYIYIYIYDISSLMVNDLTHILLMWRKWWANNASK